MKINKDRLYWENVPPQIRESDCDFMGFSQPLSFRDYKEARDWAWEYQQWWITYLQNIDKWE